VDDQDSGESRRCSGEPSVSVGCRNAC
jgi:hypothetical protein